MNSILFVLFLVICIAYSKPLENTEIEPASQIAPEHKLFKRFINPSMTSGGFRNNDLSKIRAKRDLAEECERLRLCKLHAGSSRNFIAAFELYFVNKENARLWDHRQHSSADCDQRYSCDT
ncbi:uncharacterized protein LOC112049916 [Bicyclus anynana]|uniref:Uncharacterized protein LOC112049916 n=1 Tax=Bicyclus anynana TaxID=110368 RepID=A0A6J1NFM1_BICAN|nr:uncharacterized protein LOC112049916 [Bicyclus anynana]